MITLTKSGNAIVFTFDDNDHYLNDGKIEVPVNSLTLVTDESQMATFKRSATNDIFISATYDELGMSKSDLESWFKENACGSTGGGGGGVTSGEVQTMIDESISGKADTSDVQNVASDVATVSGDVNTLSGSVESNHNAITALNGDVSSLSGDVANKADTTAVTASINAAVSGKMDTSVFNTYSASTDARISEDEEVTSAALNELNDALDDKADTSAVTASITAAVSGKQDTLVSGTNIKTINNESLLGSGNIDIQGGSSINVVQTTGTSTGDVMSQNAVTSNMALKSAAVGGYQFGTTSGVNRIQLKSVSNTNIGNEIYYPKINNKGILTSNSTWAQNNYNFQLVETSAITSSVTSASTDSQVPSAKAVYDALQGGGGGNNVIELTQAQYDALTDIDPTAFYIITDAQSLEARVAEDEEVTAAALNELNNTIGDINTILQSI